MRFFFVFWKMSWKKNRTSFIEIDVIDEKWNVSRMFAGMTFVFSYIFLKTFITYLYTFKKVFWNYVHTYLY